ncbi:phosphoribosylanthranilate isomerase [Marinobacter bryozoorum]|uniref:phosphoribosylanthranilate isomerase n=1 Tax=Marinobacter bryozoorum TaxID=256324 RepID=UPI0020040874|nr:phosphoribosylanthranilate isomerase [Marinobacter bryozoorum]MCK7544686.1 phosphoribosylanthranilate isomerase [Marinobacter bryozoorum]
MRTRTKICGITRPEDALAAARAGVDAIGLVFYEPSPRCVTLERAVAVAEALPAFVTLTGLFVNPDRMLVEQVLSRVPLDLLQFHGDESPDFCSQFHRRWIKAIRVRERADIEQGFNVWGQASGLLVDAYDPERYGGTGQRFDWSVIPERRPIPLILAGGLDATNVAEAIHQVRPWGVDVSGGVEASDQPGGASPAGSRAVMKGIKDAAKITEFLSEVNSVNQTD